jgi:hypothetical protein
MSLRFLQAAKLEQLLVRYRTIFGSFRGIRGNVLAKHLREQLFVCVDELLHGCFVQNPKRRVVVFAALQNGTLVPFLKEWGCKAESSLLAFFVVRFQIEDEPEGCDCLLFLPFLCGFRDVIHKGENTGHVGKGRGLRRRANLAHIGPE